MPLPVLRPHFAIFVVFPDDPVAMRVLRRNRRLWRTCRGVDRFYRVEPRSWVVACSTGRPGKSRGIRDDIRPCVDVLWNRTIPAVAGSSRADHLVAPVLPTGSAPSAGGHRRPPYTPRTRKCRVHRTAVISDCPAVLVRKRVLILHLTGMGVLSCFVVSLLFVRSWGNLRGKVAWFALRLRVVGNPVLIL